MLVSSESQHSVFPNGTFMMLETTCLCCFDELFCGKRTLQAGIDTSKDMGAPYLSDLLTLVRASLP
jgi:hypothetical protein